MYEAYTPSGPTFNTPFKRALRKYGFEKFDEEILTQVDTREEAIELEKYYIKKYKTYYKYLNSNGYNATIGGECISTPIDRAVQIDRFTLDVVKIWDSVADAEYEMHASIYDAINKFDRIAKDCFWFYEHNFRKYESTYRDIIMRKNNYVCQLDFDMNLIKIWTGSAEIKKKLGFNQGNISECCLKKRNNANGYYWMYYEDYVNGGKPKETVKNCVSVLQFDKEGNLIKKWDSMKEASVVLNINISCISESCTRTNKTAGGFLWRRSEFYDGERVSFQNKRFQAVFRLDNDGNILNEYQTITQAAKDNNIPYQNICRAIRTNMRAGGYRWRAKNDIT